jgi:hypothetical protein
VWTLRKSLGAKQASGQELVHLSGSLVPVTVRTWAGSSGSQLAASLAGRGWNVISATRVVYERRRSARQPDSRRSRGPLRGTRCRGPAGRGSPSSRVVPVRIARPAAAAGRRLISPPTPISGISAGQGYPTKVSPGQQGPLDGRTQLDLAAALDQLAAVYWRAGFPARR